MGLLWTEKMIREPKNIGGTTTVDTFDYGGQIHHRGCPPGCPEWEETPPGRGAIGAIGTSLMGTGMEVCKCRRSDGIPGCFEGRQVGRENEIRRGSSRMCRCTEREGANEGVALRHEGGHK